MNTEPKCERCNERVGAVYINKQLTCRHCARKYENARNFFRNRPKPGHQPQRIWTKTFLSVDERRQVAIDTPTHVFTTNIVRGNIPTPNA